MTATDEERRDFFERYLDQRFKSIEERIEGALRHVTDLVHMVQAEVHNQSQRIESPRAEISGSLSPVRLSSGSGTRPKSQSVASEMEGVRFGMRGLREEIRANARHVITVTTTVLSLIVALVATISLVVTHFLP